MPGVQSDGPLDDPTQEPELLAARVRELEQQVADLEREVEHLGVAVATRTRIGTAIGLLAERHTTTTEGAWQLLTRLSNHTNNKVQEVARLFVAVADGTLTNDDVARVGELVHHLPRAVAAVGLGDAGRGPTRSARATQRITRAGAVRAAAVAPADPGLDGAGEGADAPGPDLGTGPGGDLSGTPDGDGGP